MQLSMTKMKTTSTKQLHSFVSQAGPRQHPQLVLGIVNSDEVPDIDARYELQEFSRSDEEETLDDLPTEENSNDIIEKGSPDLENSINLDKEDKFRISESSLQVEKGKDEETMQGSTDFETDSSVHEDDETVVAGNESPKPSSPRSRRQTPSSHPIPSSVTGLNYEAEHIRDEDAELIASIDFDRPQNIKQKTAYDDFFVEDQAGFEVTIDNVLEDDFKVSIT